VTNASQEFALAAGFYTCRLPTIVRTATIVVLGLDEAEVARR